jgi:hypothetical protein
MGNKLIKSICAEETRINSIFDRTSQRGLSEFINLKMGNFSLCLRNQALRHEDVWGSG